MAYEVKILTDPVNPKGVRLTTFEATYPRYIHSEVLTHRMLSRNSASSRAIPTHKLIQRVIDDPVIPLKWASNQSGMQAGDGLDEERIRACRNTWLAQRDRAVTACRTLHELGLHKQWANRLIEPWMWITVILSGTEWANVFALRNHPAAQPEFGHLALMLETLYSASTPRPLADGEWHMPLIFPEDAELDVAKQIRLSAARCARVSYLTHDGRRDPAADLELHERLCTARPGHWSPFEHVAVAMNDREFRGNFRGWRQYRKLFEGENVDAEMLAELRAEGTAA